jgi:hypothetical protein
VDLDRRRFLQVAAMSAVAGAWALWTKRGRESRRPSRPDRRAEPSPLPFP